MEQPILHCLQSEKDTAQICEALDIKNRCEVNEALYRLLDHNKVIRIDSVPPTWKRADTEWFLLDLALSNSRELLRKISLYSKSREYFTVFIQDQPNSHVLIRAISDIKPDATATTEDEKTTLDCNYRVFETSDIKTDMLMEIFTINAQSSAPATIYVLSMASFESAKKYLKPIHKLVHAKNWDELKMYLE